MNRRLLGALATVMTGLWLCSPGARAETEVDVALVLAVDVSRSMDPDEQELQRQGFMEAFRSPQVHDAIRNGMVGRIIVTYVEWSGVEYQNVIVPWSVIEGPEGAMKFADGLSNTDIAARLDISEKTVRNHTSNLFDKLGVWSRAQAIVFARDHGFRD